MPDIVIVASSFGADAIRRDGHQAWLGSAADAGASAFEVRRELFQSEADTARRRAQRSRRSDWRTRHVVGVFDACRAVHARRRARSGCAAPRAREGEALGARFVKLQLGGFSHVADGTAIAGCLRDANVRLVVGKRTVEGRRPACTVRPACSRRSSVKGYPDVLGMTFDIGNWQWPGEAPLEAARQLAHARRIHSLQGGHGRGCAAVRGRTRCRRSRLRRRVCRSWPRHVPRGIEFPFDTGRLQADASRYVAWLAAA